LAYRFDGKQKTLALGKYPAVTLLDARRARDAAKQLLSSGTDPAADRKATKRKRSIAVANTFEAVAQEWFEVNRGRWVETYSSRLRSRLDDDLLPAQGKRPIADIEPLEVLDAIRKIEKRDAIEMAKRAGGRLGGIKCETRKETARSALGQKQPFHPRCEWPSLRIYPALAGNVRFSPCANLALAGYEPIPNRFRVYPRSKVGPRYDQTSHLGSDIAAPDGIGRPGPAEGSDADPGEKHHGLERQGV